MRKAEQIIEAVRLLLAEGVIEQLSHSFSHANGCCQTYIDNQRNASARTIGEWAHERGYTNLIKSVTASGTPLTETRLFVLNPKIVCEAQRQCQDTKRSASAPAVHCSDDTADGASNMPAVSK